MMRLRPGLLSMFYDKTIEKQAGIPIGPMALGALGGHLESGSPGWGAAGGMLGGPLGGMAGAAGAAQLSKILPKSWAAPALLGGALLGGGAGGYYGGKLMAGLADTGPDESERMQGYPTGDYR